MSDTVYADIAVLYDRLMRDVPYRRWVSYVESAFSRFGLRPRRLLDLACGTGSVSLLLADRGYEVLGVDLSPQMLEVARQKSGGAENPRFYCQDLRSLDLDGILADGAVSLFDSLNYLTSYEDLCRAFAGTAAHLSPGGLFVFDLNTERALASELFTQDNLSDRNANPLYVWKSLYDGSSRISNIRMLFFLRQPDGGWRTIEEEHRQRAHSVEEVHQGLRDAGLSLLGIYDECTFDPVRAGTDRMYVVARKE